MSSTRVHLKKLQLIDESAIDALSPDELQALAKEWRRKILEYQGILFRVKRRLFGRSSEKSAGAKPEAGASPAPSKARGETTKKPSERYPDAKVREEKIGFPESDCSACAVCGADAMADSGMTEISEYLDVEAKNFTVVQQVREKRRCTKCHASIVTAPLPPRVTPGGSYSDELIVDATVSKYCDLIPMERYCQMAGRGGLLGLPPHSLIQASFRLAEFLRPVYDLTKREALDTPVLLADETPHRMLEGDAKQRWYLWGFSSFSACFFECHDTRSGDVSTEVLRQSSCLVLLSDAYSGYKKSITLANEARKKEGRPLIVPAYCNAHARREFLPSGSEDSPAESLDAKFVREQYEQIYKLNKEAKGLPVGEVLAKRELMAPHFATVQAEALKKIDNYSSKSSMGGAYAYFLKYFEGLTVFLKNALVPIDNNASERMLRSPVIGRKTWYGTHSRGGAATAAVHFSLVETCKMNRVNPRAYYLDAIDRIHAKRDLLTPSQFKSLGDTC
jgi:transposase